MTYEAAARELVKSIRLLIRAEEVLEVACDVDGGTANGFDAHVAQKEVDRYSSQVAYDMADLIHALNHQ